VHGRGRGARTRSTCAGLSPTERAVDRLDGVLASRLGARLQIGLVDLDDVGARRLEIAELFVHRFGIPERQRSRVTVMVVLRLLSHRERPGHRDLDPPVRDRAQKFDVSHLDRPGAVNRAHHAWDGIRVTCPIERDARRVEVDTVERRGEPVRVALAAHLSVGDDVDSCTLHVGDGEPGRVVLGLLEMRIRDAPELASPHPRRQPRPQPLAIDEPVGLRVAPDDRRDERCHARNISAERPEHTR
jgi:hypothetical protein